MAITRPWSCAPIIDINLIKNEPKLMEESSVILQKNGSFKEAGEFGLIIRAKNICWGPKYDITNKSQVINFK